MFCKLITTIKLNITNATLFYQSQNISHSCWLHMCKMHMIEIFELDLADIKLLAAQILSEDSHLVVFFLFFFIRGNSVM